MRIVWRWKANVSDYIGLPQVAKVSTVGWKKEDWILTGRDGWIGFLEKDEEVVKNVM